MGPKDLSRLTIVIRIGQGIWTFRSASEVVCGRISVRNIFFGD